MSVSGLPYTEAPNPRCHRTLALAATADLRQVTEIETAPAADRRATEIVARREAIEATDCSGWVARAYSVVTGSEVTFVTARSAVLRVAAEINASGDTRVRAV